MILSFSTRKKLFASFTPPTTTPQYRGCNIAGYGAQGYWGSWTNAVVATRNPGSGPTTGNFPGRTHAEIDYLIGKGMRFFRVVMNHEALQPEKYAAIPYAGSLLNASRYASYWTRLKDTVDYIVASGGTVLLDFHNATPKMVTYYNRSFRVSPDATQENADVLANAWAKLATIFRDQPKVWFGFHNEPNQRDGYDITSWFAIVQLVINAIRATGNTSKLLVPGLDFASARNFVSNGSAAAFLTLTDPANNLAVQVHSYCDKDNSGNGVIFGSGLAEHFGADITSNQSYNPKDTLADGTAAPDEMVAVARMLSICTWAEAHGVEIYITEFAVSPWNTLNVAQSSKAQNTWNNLIAFINAHPKTLKGVLWWIYGYNPAHQFDLMQESGADSPRMNFIENDMVSSVSIPAPSSSFPTNPIAFTKNVVFSLVVNGITHKAFVPNTYDSSHNTPMTLFVWLHGSGGSSSGDMFKCAPAAGTQSWMSLSVGGTDGGSWNANMALGVTTVMAAIANFKTHFNVNPKRVILGGYSAGGDLTYRCAFENALTFAGVIVENSSPFKDTGVPKATLLAGSAWKFNVVHIAHLSDNTYPIAGVRNETDALTAAGYPMTRIEKAGGHSGGTVDSDLINFGWPFLDAGWTINAAPEPPGTFDPTDRAAEMFGRWDPANATVVSGKVSAIPNTSGNGTSARDLTWVSSNGPAYYPTDSQMNGLPSFGPTAINQRLQATFEVTLAHPYTVYQPIYLPAITSKAFIRMNAGNYDGSPGLTFAANTRVPGMQTANAGPAVTGSTGTAIGLHIVCCVYNGSSSALYIDNMTTPVATGSVAMIAAAVLTMGSYGGTPVPLWKSGECLMMDALDDLTARRNMGNWLGSKYNVATS